MWHRLAHCGGRSSQATPAAVDKSQRTSHTEILTPPAGALLAPSLANAQATPGVTASEIKIGTTTSLSGPVSALGTINRAQGAYFKMLNEQGGIAGRKINYIILDDGFAPPKTLEQTRRLVEQDEVAFLFSQLGTGPNSAIVKYVNGLGIPHLILSVNGDKWGDYNSYPWTIPFAPSARIESQIFVKYALQQNPKSKFAILYQNDDLGRDFLATYVPQDKWRAAAPEMASLIYEAMRAGNDMALAVLKKVMEESE